MDTYALLRSELQHIPFFDDHSHVLHHNIDPVAWEGPFEVLPLARLLLDFNTRLIFISCGLPEKNVTDILMGRVCADQQKQLLLHFPEIHSRTVVRYLIRGLNELYGLQIQQINADNWDTVNAALEHSRDDFYGLLQKVFAIGNITGSALNLWSGKCRSYLTDYEKRLTPREKALDKQYFLFSTTLDCHAMAPFGPVVEAYAKDFGMPLDTLRDYEAVLEEICRWSVEEKGVRAFKNTEMYFRRLDYKLRTYEEAAPCYKSQRTKEEEKILSDYIACIVFRMAEKYDVPVQIHTGNIWGDFAPNETSPEHLAPIISTFPNTRFDLLHGGDPFFGTMALMGAGFANVYVNMSSIPCHSVENFEHWLGIYLDRIPSSKLTLGWDLFTPEILCGAALYTRDMVARVLARKVDAGLYSPELAVEIAKDIMYRSAERLFRR